MLYLYLSLHLTSQSLSQTFLAPYRHHTILFNHSILISILNHHSITLHLIISTLFLDFSRKIALFEVFWEFEISEGHLGQRHTPSA
jgi:hypothetical protein